MAPTRFPFLTFADKTLLLVLIVVTVVLFYAIPRWVVTGGTEVEVKTREKIVGRYSLDRSRTIEVQGSYGKTVLQVDQGKIRVVESPCRNKACVRSGAVGTEGGIIVCIPNGVVVKVGKGIPMDLDAVTQ